MKIPSIKFLLTVLGLAACMAVGTSCNKGYGCPSDFSVEARTEAPVCSYISC